MADAKHTPRNWEALPWEAEAGGKDWNVWGPKSTNHPNDNNLRGEFGSEAEARLIAAAPEMLWALQRAYIELACLVSDPADPEWPEKLNSADRECLHAAYAAIRAAIAKAEGQEECQHG